MNRCPACGAENRPAARFCHECGNRLLLPAAEDAPPLSTGVAAPYVEEPEPPPVPALEIVEEGMPSPIAVGAPPQPQDEGENAPPVEVGEPPAALFVEEAAVEDATAPTAAIDDASPRLDDPAPFAPAAAPPASSI